MIMIGDDACTRNLLCIHKRISTQDIPCACTTLLCMLWARDPRGQGPKEAAVQGLGLAQLKRCSILKDKFKQKNVFKFKWDAQSKDRITTHISRSIRSTINKKRTIDDSDHTQQHCYFADGPSRGTHCYFCEKLKRLCRTYLVS